MFIYVRYKDPAELSCISRSSSMESDVVILDLSVEKTLLVNPNCYVRVLLEYVRKSCKLPMHTRFDMCDESGKLLGLFSYPTYASATHMFELKKHYYIIVIKEEYDPLNPPPDNRGVYVFPQVNRENKLYAELEARVRKNFGDVTPPSMTLKIVPTKKK